MSNNTWRNGLATGLIVGISFALNILLWFSNINNSKRAQHHDTQNHKEQPYKNDSAEPSFVPEWWLDSGHLIESGDTLAQWIMAIFTIIASILLLATLWQANKTNISATNAANAAVDSNQIMRDEQRPWVVFKREIECQFDHFTEDKVRFNWHFQLLNKGKMPAHNVRVQVELYRYDWSFVGAGRQGVEDVIRRATRKASSTTKVLFSDEETEFIPFREFEDVWQYNQKIRGEDKGTLFLCACVAYDLEASGSKTGYQALAMLIERDTNSDDPLAHTVKSVGGYEKIA